MGELREKLIRSRTIWFMAGCLGAVTLSNALFDGDNESSVNSEIPTDVRPDAAKKIPFRSKDCERFKLKLFANKLGAHLDDGSGKLNYYIEHSGMDDIDPTNYDDREKPTVTFTSTLEDGKGERSWFVQKSGDHNITFGEKTRPADRFSAHIDVVKLTTSSANVTGYVCSDSLREMTPKFDPDSLPTQRA